MAWTVAIIGCLLGGVLLVLLFAPLSLRVDSEQEEAAVSWLGATARLELLNGHLRYRLDAPFVHRSGNVLDLIHARAGAASHPRSPRQGRSTRKDPWRTVRRVLRSFHVRQLQWHLDTGDPLWNAWLYPLFHYGERRGYDVHICFTGRSVLRLHIRNNAFRLLRAALG